MASLIGRFRGQFFFLSNFYRCGVAYEGGLFPSSENAYQAAKCENPKERVRFKGRTSSEAKQLGKWVSIRSDWEQIKLEVMEQILRSKFSSEKMQQALLSTGDAVLVEYNNWGDTFWGKSKGWGLNHLGELLMRIRDELRLKHIAVIGGRNFDDAVLLYKRLIPLVPFILISGGAQGADTLAEEFADDHELQKIIHPADWKTYGRSAGFKRNVSIIEDSDCVVAFWDGKSKGTAHSIRLAREKGLLVDIVKF